MKKKIYIIIIVLICFSVWYEQFNRSISFGVITEGMSENNELKISTNWDVTNKILIDNNWSDARDTYDWCSGSGTLSEPYTIENITMDGQSTGACIEIRNTNDFFLIRNSAFLNTPDTTVPNHEYGIFLDNVTNGIIDDCIFLNNTDTALGLQYCEYITISNNNFETDIPSITVEGIILHDHSSNILIQKNRFKIHGAGIFMGDYCDDNIIRDNILEKSDGGNRFDIAYYCDNNLIENNTFNGVNLRIINGQFNKVLNNTFLPGNFDPAIYLRQSYFTTIVNNVIEASLSYFHDGIHLKLHSDSNYIYHNTISGCDISIWLEETSNNNTISSNTLRDSVEVGIHVTGDDNKVFYNIFERNPINAIDDGYDTTWNETTAGNSWDDYAGVDANDDGIGDTPYNISSNLGRPDSQDHLPIWYTIPQITINSPANDSHWNTEPLIDLIATDDTLNCTWYNVSYQREFLQSGVAEYLRTDIWSSLPEGPFLIEFFANDSININDENKFLLTKDTIAPVIEIINPLESAIFTTGSIWFEVSITEPNIDLVWYTINNQETRYYFEGLNGTIDGTAWNSLPNGNVNITFGVNDKAGNIAFKSITVKKQYPEIPSYNLLVLLSILLGIIAVLSLLRIKKLIRY